MKSTWCWMLLCAMVIHVFSELNIDYYEVLEVEFEATDAEIKRAYRRLSLQYHPDKNQGDKSAQDKFQQVARAYEVLSNPEKRQVYDLEGEEGLKAEESGEGRAASPFDHFFGGGGGKPKGPNAGVEFKVTLEELYNGAMKKASFERNVICRKCRGTGAKNGEMKVCPKCRGQGVILVERSMGPGFTVQMQQHCDQCGGKGQIHQHKCPHCHGHKVVPEKKIFEVTIEKGMPSDHQIVFEKQSEQRPGMIPGDVVFQLRQKKHVRFRRAGDDLHYQVKLTLEEALLGFKKNIKQLDERDIAYQHDGVTKPFEIRTIEDEGMPHHNFPSERGDMFVENQIIYPKALTDAQKELVGRILPQ